MIFKKPYAFLIKKFKIIHLILTVCIFYLTVRTASIIQFINEYMASTASVVGKELTKTYFTTFMYVLPILIIIFSVVVLIVMAVKEKPRMFYVVNIIIYIAITALYIYGYVVFNQMEQLIVDTRVINALGDLFTFAIFFQIITLIISFIRGIGFDFKKFDFKRDLQQLEISASDAEEFELDFNFDINDRKRKNKKRMRYIRYTYRENKFLINIVLGIVFALICFFVYKSFNIYTKTNSEGTMFQMNGFTLGVSSSYLVNSDETGSLIGDDKYLVVVDLKIKKNVTIPKALASAGIELHIGEKVYHHTTAYNEILDDIGITYNSYNISDTFEHYLLVYEIPEIMITSSMNIGFYNTTTEQTAYVKLKFKDLTKETKGTEAKLGEELSFKDTTLKDTILTINSYEIANKFKINYTYCLKTLRCVASSEYLTPHTGLSNYDKSVLKLEVNFNFDEEFRSSTIKDFYSMFEETAYIEYKIGDTVKTDTSDFRQIKSNRVSTNNTYYIEILSEIESAESIAIVFDIRGTLYKYYLK